MKLTIKYFASLAETRGLEEETLIADSPCTAGVLYEMLKEKYAFSLDASAVRVAVNHEYQDFDAELHDGDMLVFIPPVSGG